MVLYLECQINKNALLQTVFSAFFFFHAKEINMGRTSLNYSLMTDHLMECKYLCIILLVLWGNYKPSHIANAQKQTKTK